VEINTLLYTPLEIWLLVVDKIGDVTSGDAESAVDLGGTTLAVSSV